MVDRQGGKSIILIPKLELVAGDFLSQQIEARLGLRQVLSSIEQETALQTSQQEQKRIEAGQTKMLIPLLMIMAPLLLIGGIWMLISTSNAQREARASMSWRSVIGQSSGYTVYENVPDSDDSWDTYYDAEVRYTYWVDGESYAIDRWVPGRFDTQAQAAQFVEANYPPGTTLTLYYNPEKPSRALVDRSGPGSSSFVMAGVAIGCGLLAFVTLIFTARWICHAEGCPDDWKRWNFWLKQVPILGQAVR